MISQSTLKRFDALDETRNFPKGKFETVQLGHTVIMKKDDLFYVPDHPHDSWVVGNEPYVSRHFMGANSYASTKSDELKGN